MLIKPNYDYRLNMVDTVKERLDKMRYEPENPSSGDKLLTPETIFMKKVEKSIMKIDNLRTKMTSGSEQYISLYEELKEAEQDFCKLINDPETKFMDFPSIFVSRVDTAKKKLITKKL